MAVNHAKVLHICDQCGGHRKHDMLGSWQETSVHEFWEPEVTAVRYVVEDFLRDYAPRLANPMWMYGYKSPFPDLRQLDPETMQLLAERLDDDGNLKQDLGYEDHDVWKLRRSNWSWPQVLDLIALGYEKSVQWQIVRCAGCEETSFRLVEKSQLEDNIVSHIGEVSPGEKVSRFPPFRKRLKPEWIGKLPSSCRDILLEVYVSFEADCFRLASIGLRSVIEIVVDDLIDDSGNKQTGIRSKICRLDPKLGDIHRDELIAIAEYGNASVHRAWNPPGEDVEEHLNATESFLKLIYVSPEETKTRLARPPQRPSKSKTGSEANEIGHHSLFAD